MGRSVYWERVRAIGLGKSVGDRAVAKVELYNLIERGRAVGKGYLVARHVDGCRANTIRYFDADEQAARAFAADWNECNPT